MTYVNVTVATHSALVVFDEEKTNAEQIKDALEEGGYPVTEIITLQIAYGLK